MPDRMRVLLPIAIAALARVATALDPAPAQPYRPLCVHDIVTLAYPHDAAFSPDGEWIAYIERRGDLAENLVRRRMHIVARSGGQPRPVTSEDATARHPAWSPRGDYLAYLRSPRAEESGAEEKDQVWLMPLRGGQPFALTDLGRGVIDFAWAPDGSSLFVLAPEESAAGLREFEQERESRGFDAEPKDLDIPSKLFWRYPVPEGDPQLLFRGDPGIDDFAPSPEGDAMAWRSNRTGVLADELEMEIYVMRDGQVRRVTLREGSEGDLHWTHDGMGLIFTATLIDTISFSQSEVYVLPLGPHPLESPDPVAFSLWLPWTSALDREVEDLVWPRQSGPGYVIAADGFSQRLARMNGDGGAQWLTEPETIVRDAAVSWDGRWLALTVETAEEPAKLVLADAEGKIVRVLADPNAERFRSIRPAPQRIISWQNPDGVQVEGLLVGPWHADAQPPHPLLVDVHGGPSWHVTSRLVQTYQAWAAEGYLVLAPNFRGSTGYGNDFSISNLGDLGGGDYEDIMAGVDLLIADGLADPSRLAITGASYGGYLTNWAITRTDRFAAAVSEYGIFSLITDFSMSDYPMWEKSYLRKFFWEDLDPYLRMSPAFHAQRIQTPVLILHGEEDNNTFLANSMEMYRTLRTMGKTVEFHRFPREGHGFSEPAHEIEEFRLARRWLDRHVTDGALWPPAYASLRALPREYLPAYLADQIRSAERLPRLYRPGDTLRVASGAPLEAIVTSVSTPESYGLEKPGGRFVQVEMLLSLDSPGTETVQLALGDVVMVGPGGRAHPPVGIPFTDHGQTSLVRGENLSVRIGRDRAGAPRWQPLRIAFDVERDEALLSLVPGPLPPVLINMGETETGESPARAVRHPSGER